MAHIANLKKRAAAFGLTIVKHGDGRDAHGVGYNEYTIGQPDADHEHLKLYSLNGIASIVEGLEQVEADERMTKSVLTAGNAFLAIEQCKMLRKLEAESEAERAFDAAHEHENVVFKEGVKACRDGVKWYSNPYPSGSSSAYEWDRGHSAIRKPDAPQRIIPESDTIWKDFGTPEGEPINLSVKRAPSYPETVLKRVVNDAIASGTPVIENIPAEPAKPYESAVGKYLTPFGEGVEAFKAGKLWTENPYPGGSVESYQWDRGHTSVRCPELATVKPAHSHDLLCEAALCIWENMLEIKHGKPSLDEAWGKYGTVAMRHAAKALAPAACIIWDMMSDDEKQACIPYDWEFIPAFVSLVKWDEWIDFGTSSLAGGVDLASVKTAILATFAKESDK